MFCLVVRPLLVSGEWGSLAVELEPEMLLIGWRWALDLLYVAALEAKSAEV